jgi:hypothetical protein
MPLYTFLHNLLNVLVGIANIMGLPTCETIPRTAEVTINTVYATLFMYYPLWEDVLFIPTCFGSVRTVFRQYTCDFTKFIITYKGSAVFGSN